MSYCQLQLPRLPRHFTPPQPPQKQQTRIGLQAVGHTKSPFIDGSRHRGGGGFSLSSASLRGTLLERLPAACAWAPAIKKRALREALVAPSPAPLRSSWDYSISLIYLWGKRARASIKSQEISPNRRSFRAHFKTVGPQMSKLSSHHEPSAPSGGLEPSSFSKDQWCKCPLGSTTFLEFKK